MDMRASATRSAARSRASRPTSTLAGLPGGPVRGVFIRAPWIAEHGPGVEILARGRRAPVAAREGSMLAVAFHSELGEDDRLHGLFLESVVATNGTGAGASG